MISNQAPAFAGTIHLVFSSHWDREWYLPFQKFRTKLVRVLDEVLAHLESGLLPFYQLDGQWLPIEDYLQIRPEKEALIRELVGAGRLLVGPWYNLPDEFLVSGESLVRNFLLGMKRAESFGGTSRAGWLCDIFGHNSQMPQVLQELGINNAFLWRGVDLQLGTPFRWRAADQESGIVAHRFEFNGYGDFDYDVRRSVPRDEKPSVAQMIDFALTYIEKTAKESSARDLLWMDGGDHLEFDPAILDVVRGVNEKLGREAIQVSTLDRYIAALHEENSSSWREVEGELREPCSPGNAAWLIPGVGSSRVPLKRANHAGETLLTLWAEPWCAAAALEAGREYPFRALELAWEYLLKNHPHDSICGCSTDETHAAMPYRFDQSRQIAEAWLQIALESLSTLALYDAIHAPPAPEVEAVSASTGEETGSETEVGQADATRLLVREKGLGLSLFAPVGGAAQGCPEAVFSLPVGWPQFTEFFGFEAKPSFRIYTVGGEEVLYQLLEVVPSTVHLRVPRNKFPQGSVRQRVRLALDTVVEAGRANHFVVRRSEGPTRIPARGAIGVARDVLRNEHLEVRAHPDGTLSLTELATGRSYSGLLAMEDGADIGDGWFHGVALQDIALSSTGGRVTFGLTENGPLLARLKMRVEWPVPCGFDFKTYKREEALVPLVVEHIITLRKGQKHVEVDVTVFNTARDHRLRLLCPTNLGCDMFWSDTPFDAVERSLHLREDNHLLRELQVEMTAQQNWVAASNGEFGLALLAPGQYESAVLDQSDRPLCLTLLRAFRRTVLTDGEEGGQIQGRHTFKLGLMPFAAPPDSPGEPFPSAALFHVAQSLAAPVRTVSLDEQDLEEVRASLSSTSDPATAPRVDGEVVVSACFQESAGRWTWRVFNPSSRPRTVRLSQGQWMTSNARGENQAPVTSAEITLRPRQIMTLQALIGEASPSN